ncbi:unnamed protein product [Cuscuta europaea]|uniref:Jacalin-type lectin domain-containing protein n=1 Tax=Cuscuta europaea TaxID=41803 RepID=A0A9P1EAN2_CUSEU|nr:unnamed protein product [Cuscuta europaea]
MIRLDCPTEFLTEVHGLRSFLSGPGNIVSSITFVTNKSTYGPFGKTKPSSDDSDFEFRLGSGGDDSINGFHGTINSYYGHVASIGIYLQISTPAPRPNVKLLHF